MVTSTADHSLLFLESLPRRSVVDLALEEMDAVDQQIADQDDFVVQ